MRNAQTPTDRSPLDVGCGHWIVPVKGLGIGIGIVLVGIVMGLQAQPTIAGPSAGAFLTLGVGARAAGVGGAVVACTEDGTSFYWNPSGLSFLSKRTVTMMYASLFGAMDALGSYHTLGYAQPLREGVLSVAWVRLSVDDIPRFPELKYGNSEQRTRRADDALLQGDGKPIGSFSDHEDALYLSFSKMNAFDLNIGWQFSKLHMEMPMGVNLKFIHYALDTSSARGIGMDLGMQVRFGIDELLDHPSLGKIALGLLVRDVASTVITWETRQEDVIPSDVRIGAAYIQPLWFTRGQATLMWERKTRHGTEQRVGIEYVYGDRLVLRTGYDGVDPVIGIGFRFGAIECDYALSFHDLGAVHRLSGALQF